MGAIEIVSNTVKVLQRYFCRDTSVETVRAVVEVVEEKYGVLEIPRRCSK